MKRIVYVLFLVSSIAFGQNKNEADSLIRLLSIMPEDTNKVWILDKISGILGNIKPNIGIEYAEQGIELAQKIQFQKGEVMCLSKIGTANTYKGEYAAAFDYQTKALKMAQAIQYKEGIRRVSGQIVLIYSNMGDHEQALQSSFAVLKMAKEMNSNVDNATRGLGEKYLAVNKLDSALYYTQKAYEIVKKDGNIIHLNTLAQLGNIYTEMGDYKTAMIYYQDCLTNSRKVNSGTYVNYTYGCLSKMYKKMGKIDSCVFYAEKKLIYSIEGGFIKDINEQSTFLASYYDTIAPLIALKYYRLVASTKDSIFNPERFVQFQKISLAEQRRLQELAAKKERANNMLWRYGLLLGFLFMGVIALILFRNNKLKQQANQQLQEQKDKVENTLLQLKFTQTQLIQKEKLASLGELTAGIAHEIQNPLNFVNNFSELSVDLVKDLKHELKRPEKDETYIDELFDDLSQNQEKINHHGKRASSIVKGMLEHSRASTGVRELTDINKLADEYLRLSYHACLSGRQGLRAEDKDFNADFSTDFDENLPKIEVIPQDIGRVLLNLINNAFYTVNEKSKRNTEGVSYKPTVIVSTQYLDNLTKESYGQIIIKVKDNGTGMPEAVRTKVFQPFFTTKPTGQGTGLGLSLAYDIVTKGHGGTLEVVSTEGVGSKFIICLPFKTNGL